MDRTKQQPISSFPDLLFRILGKPEVLPANIFKQPLNTLTDTDRTLLKRIGLTSRNLYNYMEGQTLVNFDRHKIYFEIDRALTYFLMGSALELYCLDGDTHIPLLNGTCPTIRELTESGKKDFWVYSYDTSKGKYMPAKASLPHISGRDAEMVKVVFDDGEYVRCTPDHMFMLKSGKFMKAKDLKSGDSLMPLYRKYDSVEYGRSNGRINRSKKLYEHVYDGERYVPTHRWVYKFVHKYFPIGNKCIHHANFNMRDNRPENLEELTLKEHFKKHTEVWDNNRDWMVKQISKGMRRAWSTKEYRQKLKKHLIQRGKESGLNKRGNNISADEILCGLLYFSNNSLTVCSNSLAKYLHIRESLLLNRIKNLFSMDFKQFREKYYPSYSDVLHAVRVRNGKSTLIKHPELRQYQQTETFRRNVSAGMKRAVCLNHKVVSVVPDGVASKVYDIYVEGTNCFAAGTDKSQVIVHNSEVATNYSQLHGASVWITSDSQKYTNELTKLLDHIGIEEKIFDWAWTVGAYGDLFVRMHAKPGTGIISVDDDQHPLNVSRVDYNGRLVGFFNTPIGYMGSPTTTDLLPPWEFVHLRLLGAKRKRPSYHDPQYSEYRTVSLMCADTRQASSKYGTCLPYFVPVETDKGTFPIGKIVGSKMRVKVKSFNKNTGAIEWSSVSGWSSRSHNEDMVRIKFDGGKTGKSIHCTPEHPILVYNKGWVEAKDVTVNDYLMVETPEITNDQKQILLGGLLGDGCVSWKYLKSVEKDVCGSYMFTQSVRHHTFFDWIVRNLSNFKPVVRKRYKKYKGKSVGNLTLQTRRAVVLDDVFAGCYIDGRKIITKDILYKLDELGLAVWFMGDGSVCKSGGNKYKSKVYRYSYAVICTDSFTHKECVIIRDWLLDRWGIKSRVACPPSTNKCRIIISIPGTRKLLRLIAPYVYIDHTSWGLDKKQWVARDIVVSSRRVVAPVQVRGVELYSEDHKCGGGRVYDIEVKDNHNFLVHGAVVHNSLLLNAIPVYKRLRLAEDSVLLARLSKGLLRYLYKVKVDGTNLEAVAEIMDEYTATLKQARALDTTSGSENFDSKYNPMAVNEDIVLPVWGDAGDLSVEKLGGEPDIRWIKDVEDLRNQLSVALRVPLQLLGGFTKDLPSSLGTSALERIDIRFARASRRLQRSVLDGIKRMCQIHLAYMGMDPDPSLFEVNMAETSSAEEEELKDALDKGVDVVDKLSDLIAKHTGDRVDKLELLDYLNQKILKLGDLDLYSMLSDIDEKRFARTGEHIFQKKEYMELLNERAKESKDRIKSAKERIHNTDLLAHLPINSQSVNGKWPRNLNEWRSLYGSSSTDKGKKRGSKVSVVDHTVAPGTGWGNGRVTGNDPLEAVMEILKKRGR